MTPYPVSLNADPVYLLSEDHREWTFFIGNDKYIIPWWQQDTAKIVLSCCFLIGEHLFLLSEDDI